MNPPVELAVRSVALVVDGLVHDLNNPLTILLANLEMVTRRLQGGQALDADDHEALVECQQAAQRAAALLRDVRRLARGPAPTRVDAVLAAAVRATKQTARDARVRLLVEAEADLVVAVDEPRTALAVTTVIDALLRAAPSSAADVEDPDRVDARDLTRPGDVATLAVTARVEGEHVALEFVARGAFSGDVVGGVVHDVAVAAVVADLADLGANRAGDRVDAPDAAPPGARGGVRPSLVVDDGRAALVLRLPRQDAAVGQFP
jgi:signal transduction histidine kinase